MVTTHFSKIYFIEKNEIIVICSGINLNLNSPPNQRDQQNSDINYIQCGINLLAIFSFKIFLCNGYIKIKNSNLNAAFVP